ncbi:MAG: hypothetical protein HY721_32520, partial [Planctomycetes bacterium]|nr:hypothetical protein [Planctomycetota bacterium]
MPLPPNQIPRPVADVAIAFIRTRTDLGRAEGRWQDAPKLGRAFPLFRPDMERPAYFEVELVSAGQKAGSLVVSVLEDDFPVPSFTTAGGTAAERLRADVSSRLPAGTAPFQVIRIVRYGTGFIAAEEGQGKHLGHLGEMPCLVLGTSAPEGGYDSETREGEGTDASMEALEYESYDELRDAFAADFAPWLAERAAEAKADWDLLRRPAQPGAGGGGSSYTDCWAGSWSEQRKHSQIPQGTSPNTSSCPSGFCAT